MAYTKRNIAKTLFAVYFKIIMVSVVVSFVALLGILSVLQTLMESYNFEVDFVNSIPAALFFILISGTIFIIYTNIFSYLKKEKSIEN